MAITWKTDTTLELAEAAASRWDASIERHIGNSGNSVWLARRGEEPLILRLTDPIYRTAVECREEIDYLDHLNQCEVRVATAIPSESGSVVESIKRDDEEMLASIFRYAPGEYVDASSPYWNDRLFLEWGRTLGKIHTASRTYRPKNVHGRWLWRDELFLAHARDLIPAHDTASLRELEVLTEWFDSLPQTPETFGMTHGDFAPQNFHYHPEHGITAFDFGNCCYHWYISDIAVSLTVVRRYDERDRYRDLIIEGYREQSAIDSDLHAGISWFFRLRALYVYLSRLMKFGPNPTDDERNFLETLRGNVHRPFAW